MSALRSKPVNNGERLEVTSSFFTGLAGVQRTSLGGSFACIADQAILRERKATVDGRAATVIALRKSEVSAGILVAQFEYEEE
jgi:hypothetical protein